MRTFIIGITGGVGSRLARSLQDRGDVVSGLVRRSDQREELRAVGIDAKLGDLTTITSPELAGLIGVVARSLLSSTRSSLRVQANRSEATHQGTVVPVLPPLD